LLDRGHHEEDIVEVIRVSHYVRRKRDLTAAGHYAAIACAPALVHFQGSSSSIFVFG
jgi:hypothetical protein